MKLLTFLLQSSGMTVVIALITGFISGGSTAGLIALISHALNQRGVIAMPTLAWAFIGLAIVSLVTSIVSQLMLIRLSQNAIFQLRLRLSRQILGAELSQLEVLKTPRLLATLTEDVQAVSDAVFAIPFLCIDLAIVLGSLIYITLLSWTVLLLVCGFMLVAIGSCQVLIDRGSRKLALARDDQDHLFAHLRTVTDGVKELKLNYQRRQSFLTEDLETTAAIYRQHNILGLTYFAGTASWGRLLFFFAAGFVLFALPNLVQVASPTISSYILTFTFLMLPMDNLVNRLPILSKAGISLRKIESLGLSLESRAEVTVPPPAVKADWQNLSLKGVTHTYHRELEDREFTLGPIDLTFHPGELVFIVGGNGSGKSTLAKLITGLYSPDVGEIYLDDQQITTENREWYRQHFSVVFSDFYLFDRLMGIDHPGLDTQAQRYLEKLQLNQKVEIAQGRFSTTALSQGQRKRLTLLTAYLEDRPIYLFDEWAADQDPAFKEIFYTQFLQELRNRGKTVLVISHDDQYFKVGDRVIKLNYGQIELTYAQCP
ncbi:ABC transporter ATP-binding protein [Leptolyngbya sp. 'hensonii']|uniref:cyclic peptide export ABC transporter n=1 Tax=Leptolyngbya sp. 'hensonii' TaxID=1922337 RepID=UPI00094F837A|nr:cyclic peptide export ABC transporter [Leptolyngbya sp. 'hensonii']OLP20288.1 ABC transporter ATP-binding protein [Leptolyngbya sp. 'hensonii']